MYISIDPGKNGAAILMAPASPDKPPRVLDVYLFTPLLEGIDMIEWHRKVHYWQKKYGVKNVVIERIVAMPGQSSKTTAEQFYVLGQTKGALMMLENKIAEVYPQTWMAFGRKLAGCGPNPTGKQVAQMLAKEHFRKVAKKHTPRSKVHDGVADALGLAIYLQSDHYGQFIQDEDLPYG